ncbi:MAG: TlpA family protein disulfide reductase [Elusimicrobia bacterium]|nr:TlpA family protein disulfide reductase [Elusimicrobiota bacterium]
MKSPGRALAAGLAALWLGACGRTVPAEPRPAPQARLKLLQAPQAELDGWAALRGKLVVLEFWATWCDACLEAQPHLNDLAERFQGRPVQFISISSDPEKEVRAFLKKHRISGWVGLDESGAAFEAFRVRGLPYTVVLDPSGNILGETYPDQLTAERLEAMLQAAAVKP